jgi:hypothetical protein
MAVRKGALRVAAVAAVAALGAVPPVACPAGARPAGARASGPLLQCQGTETDTYRPGVTLQARDVHIVTRGHFGSCLGATDAVGSGSYAERFTIHAGCDDLLDGFRSRRTFRWDTGGVSVIDATGSSTAVAGQVVTTITGPVTRGRFRGRSAVETITLPQPGALRCLTTGVRHATGVTTLTVM